MKAIKIKPGEHVAILGSTGSGKSELAKYLIRHLNRVIVVDPKNEFYVPGFKRKLALPFSPTNKEFRLIWAPDRSQDGRLAQLLRRALARKHLTIYIDELQSLTDFFPRSVEILTDIIRTGRSREVAVWISTQRPAWVPRWFLSESRHKFVFTLLDKADRKRASEVVGDRAREEMPWHHFLYRTVGLDKAAQLTYDMKKSIIVRIEGAVKL